MTSQKKVRTGSRAAAMCVHLLTASGAAFALLALVCAVDRNFQAMFAWLGIAFFIDGIDGSLARAARVKENASHMDGDLLDLVVDFLTYVFVPMVALWRSDLMPPGISLALGVVVVTVSALYFADTRMKTPDQWFRGFPTLWNVFVLYLLVFRPSVAVSVLATLGLVVAMFAPIVFVHPMRVRKLRTVTIAVTTVWLVCAGIAVADDFATNWLVKSGLILTGLYVVGLPLIRYSPWAQEARMPDA